MNNLLILLTCPGCQRQLEFVRALSYGKRVRCAKCGATMTAVDGDETDQEEESPSEVDQYVATPRPRTIAKRVFLKSKEGGISDVSYLLAVLMVSGMMALLSIGLVVSGGYKTITGDLMLFFLLFCQIVCVGLIVARPPAGAVIIVVIIGLIGIMSLAPFVLIGSRDREALDSSPPAFRRFR